MNAMCPVCGQSMHAAHAPLESLSGAPLSRRERQIVDALTRVYPRTMGVWQLVDAVYGADPNGGPNNSSNVIAHFVSRLRRRLPAYGWTIPVCRPGHGQYTLRPVKS